MEDPNGRYGLINWKAELLTAEQILEKCKTEKGRKEVAEYIMKARVAYGLQWIFERLEITPSVEAQQECCLALYQAIWNVPIDHIMIYARSVAEGLQAEDHGLEC